LPFGIDDMSNAADNAYSAWPERIYIIDESGRIAYRGGVGPFNYKTGRSPRMAGRALRRRKTRTREINARCDACISIRSRRTCSGCPVNGRPAAPAK